MLRETQIKQCTSKARLLQMRKRHKKDGKRHGFLNGLELKLDKITVKQNKTFEDAGTVVERLRNLQF